MKIRFLGYSWTLTISPIFSSLTILWFWCLWFSNRVFFSICSFLFQRPPLWILSSHPRTNGYEHLRTDPRWVRFVWRINFHLVWKCFGDLHTLIFFVDVKEAKLFDTFVVNFEKVSVNLPFSFQFYRKHLNN